MTTEDAAHQAADREGFQLQDPIAYGFRRARRIAHQRDLYVRAFLAGAQWQQLQDAATEVELDQTFNALMNAVTDEETDLHEAEEQERHLSRVEPLTNSPTPATGSIASPDTAESPQRGKS